MPRTDGLKIAKFCYIFMDYIRLRGILVRKTISLNVTKYFFFPITTYFCCRFLSINMDGKGGNSIPKISHTN